MDELCSLCDKPLPEDGNEIADTLLGLYHQSCWNEWLDDAEYRRGDEECDRMRGT